MAETALSAVSQNATTVQPVRNPRPGPVPAGGSTASNRIDDPYDPEDYYDVTMQTVPDDPGDGGALFGKDGLTFDDFLDVINPLQHIPIISTIYRAITGDEISPAARVAGGALYGGPIGVAVAAINAIVETETGEDIGENIVTAFTGKAAETPVETAAKATAAQSAPSVTFTRPVTLAEADPAIVGPGTLPPSLLPPKPEPTGRAALLQAPRRAPLHQPATLPYGGIGTVAGLNTQGPDDDPVAALLHARAAVPLAGPVPGLGNRVPTRMTAQPALPSISPKLADKLSALAAQTAPPKKAEREEAAPPPGDPTATVSPALVPQRMIETLDRYERMKKTGPSAS